MEEYILSLKHQVWARYHWSNDGHSEEASEAVPHVAGLFPMDGTHGFAGKDPVLYKVDGKAEAVAPLPAGTEDKLVAKWVEVQ